MDLAATQRGRPLKNNEEPRRKCRGRAAATRPWTVALCASGRGRNASLHRATKSNRLCAQAVRCRARSWTASPRRNSKEPSAGLRHYSGESRFARSSRLAICVQSSTIGVPANALPHPAGGECGCTNLGSWPIVTEKWRLCNTYPRSILGRFGVDSGSLDWLIWCRPGVEIGGRLRAVPGSILGRCVGRWGSDAGSRFGIGGSAGRLGVDAWPASRTRPTDKATRASFVSSAHSSHAAWSTSFAGASCGDSGRAFTGDGASRVCRLCPRPNTSDGTSIGTSAAAPPPLCNKRPECLGHVSGGGGASLSGTRGRGGRANIGAPTSGRRSAGRIGRLVGPVGSLGRSDRTVGRAVGRTIGRPVGRSVGR